MQREVSAQGVIGRPLLFVVSLGLVPSIANSAGQILEANELEAHRGLTWTFSFRGAVLATSILLAFALLTAILVFVRETWGLVGLAGLATVSFGLVFYSELFRTQPGVGCVNVAASVITIATVATRQFGSGQSREG